jgi:hypothetical protein
LPGQHSGARSTTPLIETLLTFQSRFTSADGLGAAARGNIFHSSVAGQNFCRRRKRYRLEHPVQHPKIDTTYAFYHVTLRYVDQSRSAPAQLRLRSARLPSASGHWTLLFVGFNPASSLLTSLVADRELVGRCFPCVSANHVFHLASRVLLGFPR